MMVIHMHLEAAAANTGTSPFYFLFLSGDAQNTRHVVTVILKTKSNKENMRKYRNCAARTEAGALRNLINEALQLDQNCWYTTIGKSTSSVKR